MATSARLAALWLLAALTLWLHGLMGIPGDYLGQGYPLYPGLRVSAANLALDALLTSILIPVAGGIARFFALRLWALPILALLWLWAGSAMIQPFTIDFGTTWSGTEPLRTLFLHPLHTPIALAAFLVGAFLLNPRRRPR